MFVNNLLMLGRVCLYDSGWIFLFDITFYKLPFMTHKHFGEIRDSEKPLTSMTNIFTHVLLYKILEIQREKFKSR